MNKLNTWQAHPVVWALFCCLLWGSAPPVIKKGYELFSIQSNEVGTILVFAGTRFMLSGLLVLLFWSIITKDKRQLSMSILPAVLTLTLFQTAGQYFFYYIGLAHTTGVNGAIISGIASYFSVLFACFIFRYERMTWMKSFGCLLGFMGVLWMNHNQVESHVFGDALLLISQISGSLSAVFIKKFTRSFDPVLLSGSQFFLGGIVLCIIGWTLGGRLSAGIQGWCILLYLGTLSAIAYTIWGLLLSNHPVSKVTIFSCSIPIVGVCLSALLLQEYQQALSIDTMAALVCVCMGIYIVIRSNTKKDMR